jgi:endonuclease YncB( thermonuclease family)
MTCIAIDGDTLSCEGERIRILGVNSRELHGTCAAAAWGDRAFTVAAIRRGPLILERHGLDRYGRTLAVVYVGWVAPDRILAEWIIAAGHGEPYGSTTRRTAVGRRPADRC